MQPFDRFLYQALIDGVADTLEQGMDRARSFSHVVSDKPNQMFAPAYECWERFQGKITKLCNFGYTYRKSGHRQLFGNIVILPPDSCGLCEQARLIIYNLDTQGLFLPGADMYGVELARFTRCNTVWRLTPRMLMASSMGT